MSRSGMSRQALAYLLGGVGVLMFGGSLPATRLSVVDLDPWFVTSARAAIAGAAALLLLVVLRRPPPLAHLGGFLVVALTLVLGFPGLTALAMTMVPAAHGGVVLGVLPLATAVGATLFFGERPSLGFWIAGLAGAALVVAFTLIRAGGWTPTAGDLVLFLAVVVTGYGYAISARLTRDLPGWEVIAWALVLSLPVALVGMMLTWPADPAAVSIPSWVGVLYVGLFPQFIGYFFWNTGLAMGGIAKVGQLQLLQSFVTLAIAAVILGETIDTTMIVFAALVMGCVMIGARTRVARA